MFPYTGLIDEDWLSELIQQVLPTTTTIAPQEHPGLQQRGVAGVLMPMALLGPSARQQQSGNSRGGNFNDPAAMSAGLGMQAYHNAAAPTSHSQHAILAAAAAAAAAAAHNQGLTQAASGFYPTNSHHPQQQQPQQQSHHSNSNNGSNNQQPAQEAQPDRPIGYGAFGVVW